MERIAILGSGMAGFGAAYRLHGEGLRSVMYDKNSYYGGHTASFKYDSGFVFDEGPHVSFTKDERIQKLFAESVEQKFEVRHSQANNYWNGYWIEHPAQCHLHGLPTDLVIKVLCDFIQGQNDQAGPIRNYAEWLIAGFGRTFAETFPMAYGLKYHTTPASNMSTDWLGPRMYRPKLEEMLRGALSPVAVDYNYVTYFRYPTHNGFASYLRMFLDNTKIELGHELVKLDPKARQLHFANGVTSSYDSVVSSMPLPELIRMIVGAPTHVVEAAKKLACTTCVLVNLGINRNDMSQTHWTYFYDRDLAFTRVSYPHLLSPNNVPPGCGSVQAEVYYSNKYRPLDRAPQDLIPVVIADLKRCGVLREEDKILFSNTNVTRYAQVIFDLERADAVATVHGYLDDLGIAYCGRYGDWLYTWTDEAFISGENAAQKILDRMGAGQRV
jgi:protoporphyrinogen oxidase